jgi:hypothetical protein
MSRTDDTAAGSPPGISFARGVDQEGGHAMKPVRLMSSLTAAMAVATSVLCSDDRPVPFPRREAATPDTSQRPSPTERSAVLARQQQRLQRSTLPTQRRSDRSLDDAGAAIPESLVQAAHRAAAWTALEVATTEARREYFQAGLFEGFHEALDNEKLCPFDYLEGRRLGRNEPDAQRVGSEIGAAEASYRAREAAETLVEAQFSDLEWQARPEPDLRTPAFEPQPVWGSTPAIEEVFVDYPLEPGGMTRNAVDRRWIVEPRALYRAARVEEVFDDGWIEPDAAFFVWVEDRRRAAAYVEIRDERLSRAFRDLFAAEYARLLPGELERHAAAAYATGFDLGWDYGARVTCELVYRRGFVDGYNLAAIDAARREFRISYLEVYRDSYDQAYRFWNGRPLPRVLEATLVDGNDDGIFEPGEEVILYYRAANLGGQAGVFSATLSGAAIEEVSDPRVELSARGTSSTELSLHSRISPGTRPRTLSQVTLELAGTSRQGSSQERRGPVPSGVSDPRPVVIDRGARGERAYGIGSTERRMDLEVSYPITFSARPHVTSIDPLGQKVGLRLAVRNDSRRDIEWITDVTSYRFGSFSWEGLTRARDTTVLDLVLDEELSTAELLEGGLELEVALREDDIVEDVTTLRLPAIATDLGRRDLIDYLVELATASAPLDREVGAARTMLARRLRADWDAACRAAGNPYKDDLAGGSTSTALGELVVTYRRQRASLRYPEVFAGLASELDVMADQLPGSHPFLRKWFRRLASELD